MSQLDELSNMLAARMEVISRLKDRCKELFKENRTLKAENEQLNQRLVERDELILELEKVREFYADWKSWDTTSHAYHEQYNGSIKSDDSLVHDKLNGYFGGKLARTPLKNQKLLDEIKRGE